MRERGRCCGCGSALLFGEQCARVFEISRVHENFLSPGGGEVLEWGIDRLGGAIGTLDVCRAQETADKLGLGLVRNDLYHDSVVVVHGRSVDQTDT